MNLRIPLLVVIALLSALWLFSCDGDTVTDSDTGGNGDQPADFSHRDNPGSSALDLLTDENFDRLVVEVQFMPGAEPTSESLSNLREFLEERLHKSSVDILDPTEIPSGEQESYTADEVRDLEEEHREVYSEDNTLALYAIILDGEFSQGNVLGIAYYNTSMAIFNETVRSVSGGVGQPSGTAVESTVLLHEAGHLMGLVNNGVDPQSEHHDEENGAHCTEDDCLMYFAVRTTDFFANLFGGTVPELSEFCIEDLQAAGGR